MSSETDFKTCAGNICQELLGFERDDSNPRPKTISQGDFKKAISAAYNGGFGNISVKANNIETERLFWQLMDSLPDHVYFKDRRSRFTCVNMAQARFLGLEDPNAAIGKSDFEFWDHNDAAERFNDEQEIIRTDKGWALHEEIDSRGNEELRCIIASKLPLHDVNGNVIGTFGISRNITTRYLAEREIERQRKLLDTILQILPCRVFVRDMDDRFLIVNDAYSRSVGQQNRKSLIGKRLAEFCNFETYKRLSSQDQLIKREKRSILNKVSVDTNVSKKTRWIVTSKVPLLSTEQTVDGIVGMVYDITERKEAEEEAHRLSEELKKKNAQFEAELLVARQLQETLMSIGFDANRAYSKSGVSWNIEASYFYKPSHHLAGDFFDLVPISENVIGFLVCDVMGHGVKASLVTMLLRGLILEMPDRLEQPGSVLTQLNNSLCSLAEDRDFPRFVTAVYMVVDLETGLARIANAGHPQPLWKTTNEQGRERFVPCPSNIPGPGLGLIEDEEFEQLEFTLDGRTEFLFYTDGIIEQTDAMGKEFGIEKLEDILLNNKQESLAKQLETIQLALRLTAGSAEFADDICIVAVKLEPKQSEA